MPAGVADPHILKLLLVLLLDRVRSIGGELMMLNVVCLKLYLQPCFAEISIRLFQDLSSRDQIIVLFIQLFKMFLTNASDLHCVFVLQIVDVASVL